MQRVDGGLIATSQYSLPAFRVARPDTLADALEVLAAAPSDPVILAGGTDLVAAIREGLKPADLVSIAGIAELNDVALSADALRIGALVTHERGSDLEAVRQAVPGLGAAWGRLANVRVRGRATIGGNMMARRTRYEGSILLSALGATLHFASPAGDFALAPGEVWRLDGPGGTGGTAPRRRLLTGIEIPLGARPRIAYDRSFRPMMTLATALWDTASGVTGRAVIGTEWLEPVSLDIAGGPAARDVLATEAQERAAATFEALPRDFGDVAAGHAWLRRAGAALLSRHLADMEGLS